MREGELRVSPLVLDPATRARVTQAASEGTPCSATGLTGATCRGGACTAGAAGAAKSTATGRCSTPVMSRTRRWQAASMYSIAGNDDGSVARSMAVIFPFTAAG
ncbi:MAG: hypothetical protein JNK82_29245 [Myxococcaceae bacterium]|nr:hypothetical protein [Myxococcaceae bacterium]